MASQNDDLFKSNGWRIMDENRSVANASFSEFQWREYSPPPENPPEPVLVTKVGEDDVALQLGILVLSDWVFGADPVEPKVPIPWQIPVKTHKDNILGISFGEIVKPHSMLLQIFDHQIGDPNLDVKPLATCSYFQPIGDDNVCQGWDNDTWGIYLPELDTGSYYVTLWAIWDFIENDSIPSPKMATWIFALTTE
jgi:hypothetical protein